MKVARLALTTTVIAMRKMGKWAHSVVSSTSVQAATLRLSFVRRALALLSDL